MLVAMAIEIECPKCDYKLSARDDLAGLRVKCPQCSAPVSVPKPFSEAASEPTADIPRRPCPHCGQAIATAATKCRFCGTDFTTPRAVANSGPMRVVLTDIQVPFERAIYLVGFWWAATLVFGIILGIIGGVGLMVLSALLRSAG